MQIVVEVEHLPVVVRLPCPLERLDNLEERLEALSHRKVITEIFGREKSAAAELLSLPEVGLDQAAGRVGALHDSASLVRQGTQTLQLAEEITGPVVLSAAAPLPDECGRPAIFLRPELVMKMGDQ